MQGEKEKIRDTSEGSGAQPAQEPKKTPRDEPNPVGQDSAKSEYGEIGEKVQQGAGSAPPRSLGTKGKEFGQFADHDRSGQQGQSGTGQADLGSQAGSTLSGHTDQQELGELGGEVDQPGSFAGGVSGRQAEIRGEGFIARPSTDTDEYLQETDEQDFAREGQGAIENPEPGGPSDVEREIDRSKENDSNIEGGVG
jgi:hypothetical protein